MRIVKIPLINYCKKEDMLSDEEHQKKVDDFADQVRKETLKPIIEHLGKATKEVAYYNTDSKQMSFSKPKDWAFMQQSGEVLKNIPATWMQYPNTVDGMVKIIEMEYGEAMAAVKDQLGAEAVSHELVHLASACLHLWRRLNHAE